MRENLDTETITGTEASAENDMSSCIAIDARGTWRICFLPFGHWMTDARQAGMRWWNEMLDTSQNARKTNSRSPHKKTTGSHHRRDDTLELNPFLKTKHKSACIGCLRLIFGKI